jgi:hypothetical protein
VRVVAIVVNYMMMITRVMIAGGKASARKSNGGGEMDRKVEILPNKRSHSIPSLA